VESILDDLQERIVCLEYKVDGLSEPPGERFWKLERTVREFQKEISSKVAEQDKAISALERQVKDLEAVVTSVKQRLEYEFGVTFGLVRDWFDRHIKNLADTATREFASRLEGSVQKAIDDAVKRAFEKEAREFSAILSEDKHVV